MYKYYYYRRWDCIDKVFIFNLFGHLKFLNYLKGEGMKVHMTLGVTGFRIFCDNIEMNLKLKNELQKQVNQRKRRSNGLK